LGDIRWYLPNSSKHVFYHVTNNQIVRKKRQINNEKLEVSVTGGRKDRSTTANEFIMPA
jgi:hypothetical protein